MLHINVVQRNLDNLDFGHIFESTVTETKFEDNQAGELYRDLVKEYGRCQSKIHIDKDSQSIHIGWVFIKREQYTDCSETFLAETWVTVHEKPNTVTVEKHYKQL